MILHNEATDVQARLIGQMARQFCRSFLRQQEYLSFKPSQVAASSLLLAINLCQLDIAPSLGLKKFESLNVKSLYFDTCMNIEIDGQKVMSKQKDEYLKLWNKHVRQMTTLSGQVDVKPAYKVICQIVNANDLQGALHADPLFFPLDQ